jgi:hypothetical protein
MLLAHGACAQSSFLTIDSKNTGICVALDGLDSPACDGDVLEVDGTSDHMAYLVPQSGIDSNTTDADKFKYFLNLFINIVLSMGLVLVFLSMLYIFGRFIDGFIRN